MLNSAESARNTADRLRALYSVMLIVSIVLWVRGLLANLRNVLGEWNPFQSEATIWDSFYLAFNYAMPALIVTVLAWIGYRWFSRAAELDDQAARDLRDIERRHEELREAGAAAFAANLPAPIVLQQPAPAATAAPAPAALTPTPRPQDQPRPAASPQAAQPQSAQRQPAQRQPAPRQPAQPQAARPAGAPTREQGRPAPTVREDGRAPAPSRGVPAAPPQVRQPGRPARPAAGPAPAPGGGTRQPQGRPQPAPRDRPAGRPDPREARRGPGPDPARPARRPQAPVGRDGLHKGPAAGVPIKRDPALRRSTTPRPDLTKDGQPRNLGTPAQRPGRAAPPSDGPPTQKVPKVPEVEQ